MGQKGQNNGKKKREGDGQICTFLNGDVPMPILYPSKIFLSFWRRRMPENCSRLL